MRRGWFVVANCPPVIKVLMMLDSTQPCTEMEEMDEEGLVPFMHRGEEIMSLQMHTKE
jgi:hypothetical protein